MNKITLIGNLTKDPENRTTQNGVSVCSFNIAVNRRFPNADGERQTDFFRIQAWRGLADSCMKYLAKGRKVAVIGELQPRQYEKNGQQHTSLDVQADEVEFLTPPDEKKKKRENSDGYGKTPEDDFADLLENNDLPF